MATYICFQIAKYLQPLTLQPIHIICKFNFEYKNNLNKTNIYIYIYIYIYIMVLLRTTIQS